MYSQQHHQAATTPGSFYAALGAATLARHSYPSSHQPFQQHQQRQSSLAEYGPRGSGFDPNVYVPAINEGAATFRRPAVPKRGGVAASYPTQGREATEASVLSGGRTTPHAERAVTARQVNQLPTAAQTLDGAPLSMATIVGRVLEVAVDRAHHGKVPVTTLLVCDTTGLVAAQQWHLPTDDRERTVTPPPAVGSFVSVTGRLQPPSSARAAGDGGTLPWWVADCWLVTGRVDTLHDTNLVVHHALTAILTTLRLTYGERTPSSRGAVSMPSSSVVAGSQYSTTTTTTVTSMPSNAQVVYGGNGGGAAAAVMRTVTSYPAPLVPVAPAQQSSRAMPPPPRTAVAPSLLQQQHQQRVVQPSRPMVRHPSDAVYAALRAAPDADAGLTHDAIVEGAAVLLRKAALNGASTLDDARHLVRRHLQEMLDDGIIVTASGADADGHGEAEHYVLAFD